MELSRIDRREVGEFLKQCRFHYGYVYGDPDLSNPGEEIYAIDVWTGQLGELSVGEYSLASQIAERYSVSLIQQDFSKGGQKPIYKPVFGTTCKNITEIKERTRKLDLAKRELEIRIKMYVDSDMKKEIVMEK